jgi:hypothetical protein
MVFLFNKFIYANKLDRKHIDTKIDSTVKSNEMAKDVKF